ncbi:MAG: PqqD family protein [Deltaproteobacteria bacterium]|nr:PqqD family protein [Deltaproteobacteria bacterium]
MNTDQTHRISHRIAYRRIGEQMVIVDSTEAKLMTLNTTGTAIWERIGEKTLKQIAEDLTELFEVDFDKALEHTIEFLDTMKTRGFVETTHRGTD